MRLTQMFAGEAAGLPVGEVPLEAYNFSRAGQHLE